MLHLQLLKHFSPKSGRFNPCFIRNGKNKSQFEILACHHHHDVGDDTDDDHDTDDGDDTVVEQLLFLFICRETMQIYSW